MEQNLNWKQILKQGIIILVLTIALTFLTFELGLKTEYSPRIYCIKEPCIEPVSYVPNLYFIPLWFGISVLVVRFYSKYRKP